MIIVALVLIGLLAGALAAGLGVGGGVVFVPALVIVAGFEQQLAEGTSLAVIVPTMVVAALTHHRHRNVDWRTAIRVAVFGVVGGLAGAWIALRIDEAVLRRLFSIFLLLMAVRLVSRTRRSSHRDTD